MSRKKEVRVPVARRASMSGFSKPDSPGRGPWLVDWLEPMGTVPNVDLLARKAQLWDPAATYIEAHEGWHIAYTPPIGAKDWADRLSSETGAEVQVDDVRAIEDGRINRIGLDALREFSEEMHQRVYEGLGTMQDPKIIKPKVSALLKMGNKREAARLLIAALPHSMPLLSYRAWKGDTREFILKLYRAVRSAGLTVEGVAGLAKHVAGLPSRAPTPPPPPPPPPERWEGKEPRARKREDSPMRPPPESDTPWGRMSIVEPRLTESVYDGSDALTRPTAEPGTLPKYPMRWRPWEGSFDIFARKRRDQGKRARMSLLIDGSGSMSWSDAELVELQERLPAATVAIYGGGEEAYDAGTLCIVAAGGKRMVFDRSALREKYKVGMGNIVDGPALRWLGRQDGPRIWLSDEGVTGVGDNHTRALLMQARSIVTACGITRFRRARELFEWLDSKGFKKSAVRRLR